jgi:hypothetical protein
MKPVDVKAKLESGAYKNKLPFPSGYSSSGDNRAMYEKFRAEAHRLEEEFKADALDSVGLKGHPLAQKVWDKAWSDARAYGHLQVLNELEALAEILVETRIPRKPHDRHIQALMLNHCSPGCSHEGCGVKSSRDYMEAVEALEALGYGPTR